MVEAARRLKSASKGSFQERGHPKPPPEATPYKNGVPEKPSEATPYRNRLSEIAFEGNFR